jgi:hypothetical protein
LAQGLAPEETEDRLPGARLTLRTPPEQVRHALSNRLGLSLSGLCIAATKWIFDFRKSGRQSRGWAYMPSAPTRRSMQFELSCDNMPC